MRSCGRALVALIVVAAAAHSGRLLAQSAEAAYRDLQSRERVLRQELDLAPQRRAQPPGEATAALLQRVRTTVAAYEALAGRFPRSGYSDNALWQAAVLAADAFWQFGDSRDRAAALRLFAALRAQYPTSSLLAQVDGHTTRLNGASTATGSARLKSIRREALADTLRITLELEREAIFREERLDGPPRVFLDLRNTETVDALQDATIPFPDDLVRQVRIGRQPGNQTRVVFDLTDPAPHSVYSLYNPYRIVVDFERQAREAQRPPAEVTAAATTPPRTPSAAPPTAPVATPPKTPDTTSPTPAAPPSASSSPPARAAAPGRPAANSRGGFSLSRQLGLGVSRIVIDPGHGGHDPGAQIRGLNEAELVLDIALRLERRLSEESGAEVVLTRRTNIYVPLEERTAIANRSEADLFLSIHANASANTAVRGFETYFLNFATNPAAEAIAARENAGSSRTMGHLPDIVKAIALNNKIDESRDFAAMIQQSMQQQLRQVDRNARSLGVKQAPFMVLVGATMPSALAEISFLTNRQDAALLRSTAYRQKIAEALHAGIVKYQQSLKSSTGVATQ